MILTPFKIVYELFVFGIQALFLYGLALIIAIGFIAYAIAQHPPKKEWYPKQEKIEYIKKVYPTPEEVIKEPECIRPAGCRVLEDGTVEY
tara:strand:- start:104 stop:373 length:270 start_codon:yes stop_codon:yes gene_type:complete